MTDAITFGAVQKRFSRRFWREGRYVCKASPREMANGYGPYQLCEGNTIRDSGGIERVEVWCADVLAPNERVMDAERPRKEAEAA